MEKENCYENQVHEEEVEEFKYVGCGFQKHWALILRSLSSEVNCETVIDFHKSRATPTSVCPAIPAVNPEIRLCLRETRSVDLTWVEDERNALWFLQTRTRRKQEESRTTICD